MKTFFPNNDLNQINLHGAYSMRVNILYFRGTSDFMHCFL